MPKSNTLVLCVCLAVSLLASLVFWNQNQKMRRALESATPALSVEVAAVPQSAEKKDKSGAASDLSVQSVKPETASPETTENSPEQQHQAALAGLYEVSPKTLRELLEKESAAISDFNISDRVREMLHITANEAEAVRNVLIKTADTGRRLEGERAKFVDEKSKHTKIIEPFPEAECLQLEADFFTELNKAIGIERTGILEDVLRAAVEQSTGKFGRDSRFYTISPPKSDVPGVTGKELWGIMTTVGKEINITYSEDGNPTEIKTRDSTMNFNNISSEEGRKRFGHLFDFKNPASP